MTSLGQSPPCALDWVSERHLRIRCTQNPPSGCAAWIRSATASLNAARSGELLSNLSTTPAYDSILIEFDPLLVDDQLVEKVRRIITKQTANEHASSEFRIVDIPVCYDPKCAPDIGDVARIHGISIPEVANMHMSAQYSVRFIGFTPGFPYLDGLPSNLATPRLPNPRVRVPSGSVGIAGGLTGIYPFETAGGWRIIGRTPLRLFDIQRENPALLQPGMHVRFTAISLDELRAHRRGADV